MVEYYIYSRNVSGFQGFTIKVKIKLGTHQNERNQRTLGFLFILFFHRRQLLL